MNRITIYIILVCMLHAVGIDAMTCTKGTHEDLLLTYVLSIPLVNVSTDSDARFKNSKTNTFISVSFWKKDVPEVLPYMLNAPKEGRLYQDVLNASRFLHTWARLSGKASPEQGTFAMPGIEEAYQCTKLYENATLEGKSSTVPPNAQIVFSHEKEPRVAHICDIFDVTETGSRYVMTLRYAPSNATFAQEGSCHTYQSLAKMHYHHFSRCLLIDLEAAVEMEDNTQVGTGMTAFIKFTACYTNKQGQLVC